MCLKKTRSKPWLKHRVRWRVVDRVNGKYQPWLYHSNQHSFEIGKEEISIGDSNGNKHGFYVLLDRKTALKAADEFNYIGCYTHCVVMKCRVRGFISAGTIYQFCSSTEDKKGETWNRITPLEFIEVE